MDQRAKAVAEFVLYASKLKGDEKGEAQNFLDHLFKAFGQKSVVEAGGVLEERIKKGKTTRFADLVWKDVLLLEMKKRGEKLEAHYEQALDYWINKVPSRPRYVILCNFDEFWIYDLNLQLHDPLDKVKVTELPDRYSALNFLFPENPQPVFNNNRIEVTRAAASHVASAFSSLVARGIPRDDAQRFILQCVVAMFAEDSGLLPKDLFTTLVDECRVGGESSYDNVGSLFRQMNEPNQAPGGRFKHVEYFNGGLFKVVKPLQMDKQEIHYLAKAATHNWSKIKPEIFGTLFERSIDQDQRHAEGAHFTSEVDIMKIVRPTIVLPWREAIAAAGKKVGVLQELATRITKFRVLDPACGSGNFLYVAYRALVQVELELLARLVEVSGPTTRKRTSSMLSTLNFYGLDVNPFAVELAKVTLMLAKRLAIVEAKTSLELREERGELPLEVDSPLPLDNLENNIRCADALFEDKWPQADAIIGNPPYQSKNKAQAELGREYLSDLRARYKDVPGRADYCTYWFRRAHDHLAAGARAGLVGTNTIRQNESREASLDYIVKNGGTITEAVSNQEWSGDAVVHVSIVNWINGPSPGPKALFTQETGKANKPWRKDIVPTINAALSVGTDVTQAHSLCANAESTACFQGQTHGHKGFLVSLDDARSLIKADKKNAEVLFPFLIGEDLVNNVDGAPSRYVIDFQPRNIIEASKYTAIFKRVEGEVLPKRKAKAKEEADANAELLAKKPNAKVNKHHRNFLKKWWLLSYPREDLITTLSKIPRYIVCSRVTKRPIFAFVSTKIRPNDALAVFPLPDDYSFGIFSSNAHWEWFQARCSSLKDDPRYTSDTVFDSFPWPQSATEKQARTVAAAAVALRKTRSKLQADHGYSLRSLYELLALPGENPLKDAHDKLDKAVLAAYGFDQDEDVLAQLLALNETCARRETSDLPIVPPGLPPTVPSAASLVSDDAIQPPKL